jgi:hydrogenase-1 operon protein HyaE
MNGTTMVEAAGAMDTTMRMGSPLIDRLCRELGYPLLGAEAVDGFVAGALTSVLFLTGDPKKELESNDVAVILPELVAAFPGRLRPAVVSRAAEPELKARFGTHTVPALLFFRHGRLLGAIPRVRDWDEYRARIAALLDGDAAVAAPKH